MQPSIFNKLVPLAGRDDIFLMNTFTDAQLVVSRDVVDLLNRVGTTPDLAGTLDDSERTALRDLIEHGFIVKDRATERAALNRFFHDVREDTSELRVTLLTTLQCNFACDYCFQGDHGDYNARAEKMSMPTAHRLCEWVEMKLDELGSSRFNLTFFGGEPLLNLPVMFETAERLWQATQDRGVEMRTNAITNGLLLTPEVVDRLEPFGLDGFKITLDGDPQTHDRMRPLRGAVRGRSTGSSRTSGASPIGATSRSAAISMRTRSTATPRCSTSSRRRTSPTRSSRSPSNRSSGKSRPPCRPAASRSLPSGATTSRLAAPA